MGTEGDHNMYHRSINQFFSLIISINLYHTIPKKTCPTIPYLFLEFSTHVANLTFLPRDDDELTENSGP
jgi:hypothetical protein